MRGTNHIIANMSTAVIVDTSIRSIAQTIDSHFYDQLFSMIHWQLYVDSNSQFVHTSASIFVVVLNVLLFIIGSLLPDCDHENSIMGRMLYIPVRHRTWTHTVWCVILFSFTSIAAPCFTWLTYGYFLHILYDSLSKSGVCWMYPFSRYKTWTSGARVKKNHRFYLYRTGETSETILTVLLVLIGLGMLIYAILLTVSHGNLPFHGESLFAVNPT